MALILEGPDNSGKTTLCKDLQKMCPDVQAHHSGGRPKDEEIDQLLGQQLLLAGRSDLIVDRVTAISEQVYRPGMLGDAAYEVWLRRAESLRDCVFVYCKPPIDNLLNRESISFRDEEDEDTRHRILDNLHTYVANYEVVMRRVPHLTYDYSNELEAAWLRKYIADALLKNDFRELTAMARAKVYG